MNRDTDRIGLPAGRAAWHHPGVTPLDDALAAAARPPVAPPTGLRPAPVLLAGAGGALGAAVLEALLGHGHLHPVDVIALRPIASLHVGMRSVEKAAWLDAPAAGPRYRPAGTDLLAVCVFDRPRHANGREAAFWHPVPADLLVLARRLRNDGCERLIVVEPVDAARWPRALREGLASLDEHAVAALGLRQLVFVRPAGDAGCPGARGLQRVADGVLGALRMMLPTSLQPIRLRQLGRLVAELAAGLPKAPPGTRVLGPEALWQAAQSRDPAAWLDDWLAGRPAPAVRFRPGRM